MREGGHNYEALVRKTFPRKPIRVFLQDGENDLDNANGNWPLANQTLAKVAGLCAATTTAFEYGQGFHSNRHGRAILPDSLRWLWRTTSHNDLSRDPWSGPGPADQEDRRAVTSISIEHRADRPTRPRSSAAHGLIDPRYLRSVGQHFLN